MRDYEKALDQRRAQQLYRQRRLLVSPQGPEVRIDGRSLIAFCSNDYLGLANHPALVETLRQEAERLGVGGGASHLVCGHHEEHHRLEEALAEFTGYPAVLLFSTGYMANLGVISALTERGDTVIEDRLNHASLIDGGLLSRAKLQRYAHADVEALSARLAAAEGEKLVVTDGVFSMDGDLAPLAGMASACRRHDALLIVDDAHGFGVIGHQGRGSVSRCDLGADEVPVVIGTLGKAFGTAGAFVAGSRSLIDYLIQSARPYIYTTAMPPVLAAVTRQSLRLIRDEEWRRERLRYLIRIFREEVQAIGFQLMPSETPIQPLLVGDSGRALALSQALEAQGLLVTAIRPPTVPTGTARLRVTLSAAHTDAHLEQLLAALKRVYRQQRVTQ
ncbi:8-amino-7-oxononanoate synthase [Mangrovitalea sediminis]|uniref:8-amino-7-oxononanoate synthase n=1 Tax=Mangrovitalea sediminis TaxID=1982043 RepID=UPI000BE4D5D1|nr:8-amino-7-oxononanoate synthase [Mangrovitalea sediminis]